MAILDCVRRIPQATAMLVEEDEQDSFEFVEKVVDSEKKRLILCFLEHI